MVSNRLETYNELWEKKPQCLSEQDIFENKTIREMPTMKSRRSTFVYERTIATIGTLKGTLRKILTTQTARTREEDKTDAKQQTTKGKNKKEKDDQNRKTYNFEVHGQRLKLAANSLLLFSDKSWIRQLCVWIIFWKYTNIIIHLMIIINAIFLGLNDYTKSQSETKLNTVCYPVALAFQILFLAEAGIKIIGCGLSFYNGAYLRDPWNRLDGLVVISIILCMILGSPLNFTMFRLLRLLYVIQHSGINTMMSKIVSSLLKSFYQIFFILIMLLFIIMIFSIIGVAAFSGATHYYCRMTPEPQGNRWDISITDTIPCGLFHTCKGNFTCGSLYALRGIPDNESIEINYGVTNYDNILNSLVTTFQVSTIEGWNNLMYSIGNVSSLWLSLFYYGFCIILGGYFAFDLIIPVLHDNLLNYLLYSSHASKKNGLRRLVIYSIPNVITIDHIIKSTFSNCSGCKTFYNFP